MVVSMWEIYDRERRERFSAEYISADGFEELCEEAASKGFRKATIDEIHSSLDRGPYSPDLYCWRGGLWVSQDK
jgi:hypothetical protein